jgi:hypothetical protein
VRRGRGNQCLYPLEGLGLIFSSFFFGSSDTKVLCLARRLFLHHNVLVLDDPAEYHGEDEDVLGNALAGGAKAKALLMERTPRSACPG